MMDVFEFRYEILILYRHVFNIERYMLYFSEIPFKTL